MPEPELMVPVRLCSLTDSETQQKYDKNGPGFSEKNDKNGPGFSEKPHSSEQSADRRAGSGGGEGGHGENIYDEPTASAPLLGKCPPLLGKSPLLLGNLRHC